MSPARFAVASTLALAALSLSSACTILFALGSGDDGAFCAPATADNQPRCKDDFVCVPDDGVERCVPARFLEEGEECIDDLQCIAGFCGDGYEAFCDGEVVLPERAFDCAIRNRLGDKTKRCHASCVVDQCPSGQRCFPEGDERAFCQEATCTNDNDCVDGVVPGICVDEGTNGGKSGLCRAACDPLGCNDNNTSTPCTCGDGLNCTTPPEGEFISPRAVCEAAGVIPAGSICSAGDPCEAGSSCAVRAGDNLEVCVQWCRAGGGAPACNVGSCTQIEGNLGFCSQ